MKGGDSRWRGAVAWGGERKTVKQSECRCDLTSRTRPQAARPEVSLVTTARPVSRSGAAAKGPLINRPRPPAESTAHWQPVAGLPAAERRRACGHGEPGRRAWLALT